MHETVRGFTLVELTIVVAIIAVIAAIAIPSLASGRVSANEAAAIATLKNLHTAQSLLLVARGVDGDGDGVGRLDQVLELHPPVLDRTAHVPASTRLSPDIIRHAGHTIQCDTLELQRDEPVTRDEYWPRAPRSLGSE